MGNDNHSTLDAIIVTIMISPSPHLRPQFGG